MTDKPETHMQRIGYRTPDDVAEPEQPVLVDYVSGGRVAIVTLNRPHADNAMTIEQAAAIMMEAHWRSVVHPDRVEGIRAFNEDCEPAFQDPEL